MCGVQYHITDPERDTSEAMEETDLKKRNRREAITSHVVASSAPTDSQALSPRISPDPDPDPESNYAGEYRRMVNSIKKTRVFKMAHRAGESDKSTKGYCCQCENNGLIMSWPQCRLCFHNQCDLCWCLGDASHVYDIRAEENLTSSGRFTKVNEMSGGIGLELEALGFDESLATQQKAGLEKCWEALKLLTEGMLEMEVDTSEGASVE